MTLLRETLLNILQYLFSILALSVRSVKKLFKFFLSGFAAYAKGQIMWVSFLNFSILQS